MKTLMVRITVDDRVPSHVTEEYIVLHLNALRGVEDVTPMVFRPDAGGGLWEPAEVETHAKTHRP